MIKPKTVKKKTFVITVSKTFMRNHPKKGELTNFKKKVLSKSKIHTMRSNFKYWKSVIDKVNSGEAILSVRQWAGRPYHKDENGVGQVEITQFTKLGFQKVKYSRDQFITIDKKKFTDEEQLKEIALNDGLTPDEFRGWFPKTFTGIVIHFTEFKY
ncbi:MAG: hypothetical protein AABY22_05770 [Nanoarchaeota archaeon]